MLELLVPSLPGLLWPSVVAPDRVLSMGQIELISVYLYKTELLEIELFGYLNCVLILNLIV